MRKYLENEIKNKNIILRKTTRNGGLTNHMNEAVALAEGDIIVLAAGDDISRSDKIRKLIEPLVANKNIIGTHSAITEIEYDGTYIKRRDSEDQNKLNNPSYIIKNCASLVIQSHAFRKSIFDKFGPMSPSVTNEGIVFTLREALLGEIAYVPEELTLYRMGGTSTKKPDSLEKIIRTNPMKFTNWRLTALRQITSDLHTAKADRYLVELASQKVKQEEYLLVLNDKPLAFNALYEYTTSGGDLKIGIRAFLRRNFLGNFYRFFRSGLN